MKKGFIFILVVAFVLSFIQPALALTEGEEIQLLKSQVKELMQRIEQLEQQQVKQKEVVEQQKEELTKKVESSRVDLSNALSKLKIKGRAALGYLDSGKSGSYPSGSFEMPDAKIQFSFQPDDINAVVLRFNLNNATAQSPLLDYFYLQSKDFLPALKNTPFSLSSRLGRFKLGFGEETWSDNPVESILPSNSAGKVGVTDEGLELAGKIKLDKLKLKPLGWSVSISDGNSGVGSDSNSGKAFMGKLYYSPIDPLYLSVSYYDSGSLRSSSSEMSIAGLVTRPSGATDWQRDVWEVDARYDFGKGKKPLDPPAYSDSKAIARLSFGEFNDNATPNNRSGNFGFIDGIYNINKKFYSAGRFSFVDLKESVTASLNSATANRHDRYSLGLGYRWSENTILKLSYDWNDESGVGIEESDNDLVSILIGTQF